MIKSKIQKQLNNNFIFIGIVLLYAVLCLYKILDVPIGYNIDEVGTAVDAYYLANFGVDRYGVQLPVYFENYGGGQNALNQYLCAIFVKIFGYSMFYLKLPGVIINVIGLIYLVKLFRKLFSSDIALTVGLIYAISPYSIMRQRTILESNLAMPIMIVALYYTYRAIYDKKLKYWQISGILYGLVLWAYMYELLVLAVFLIGCLIYCIYHKRINIKQQVIFVISFVIVQWPLILFNIINMFGLQTIEVGKITIPILEHYRGQELYSFLDIINILGALIVFAGSQFYQDGLSYNQTIFGVYYITTQIIALYSILKLLKNFKKNCKNIKENFSFKFLISTLLVWNFIQQIISIQNCNKLSVQYIALLMLVAIYLENCKKLSIWNSQLRYVVYGQYLVLFLAFQVTYYSGFLQDYKPGSYSSGDITSIVAENPIKDKDKFYYTEAKEYLILADILNGKNVTVDDYKQLDNNNFKIHLNSEKWTDDTKPGQYLINKYEESAEPIINKLNNLSLEGKDSKVEYDFYIYYEVY